MIVVKIMLSTNGCGQNYGHVAAAAAAVDGDGHLKTISLWSNNVIVVKQYHCGQSDGQHYGQVAGAAAAWLRWVAVGRAEYLAETQQV